MITYEFTFTPTGAFDLAKAAYLVEQYEYSPRSRAAKGKKARSPEVAAELAAGHVACNLFDAALVASVTTTEDKVARAAIWIDRLGPEMVGGDDAKLNSLRQAMVDLLQIVDRRDVLTAIGRGHLA